MTMDTAKIGVIGLAVMGSNLARNIESRGYTVAVYNRTASVTEEFMAAHGSGNFLAATELEAFVQSIQRPRNIIVMVKAGAATDAVIESLLPFLEKNDCIIDGGNAWFEDTQRREMRLSESGFRFIGMGISGGEEGALLGPSIMPGGPKEGWQELAPLLNQIAAQVDGVPCTAYMGPDGAGHFVKMVHNGIEYGDMQLIAETYHVLQSVCSQSIAQLADVFSRWNEGVLSSFLVEISADIFRKKQEDGSYLVEQVLDKAGQKGTGRWTVQIALELGVSIPTISAAVDARVLSSMKSERVAAASQLASNSAAADLAVEDVHDALYCAKIIAYAQGMALLAQASANFNWDLALGTIASIWKGGCIIRAVFLDEIRKAYELNPRLANLLLDPQLKDDVERRIPALRKVVAAAAQGGVPVLAFASALSYYDSYRSKDLPQNLTQAQRDYFGAHTYERKDMEGVFHSEWK